MSSQSPTVAQQGSEALKLLKITETLNVLSSVTTEKNVPAVEGCVIWLKAQEQVELEGLERKKEDSRDNRANFIS